VAAASSTRTTTSVAVVANDWYDLEAWVNEDASSVDFLINGTLVATHTTNIPASSTELVTPAVSASRVTYAAANRYVDLDYLGWRATLT
jgi:hypothetical protein